MNCTRCQKVVEENMTTQKLCQNCFVDLVEHRARKSIRHLNLTKGNKILLVEDGTKEFAVTNFLLRKILQTVPLTIEVHKKSAVDLEKAQQTYDAVVLPWDMNDETEVFITAMVNKESLPQTKLVKLLQHLSDTEVKLFADIKKFTYQEKEKTDIQKALNKIEEHYPQAPFALLNSIKTLQKKQ